MTSRPNQFRLFAYIGVGVIVFGLFALIFFGMPKLDGFNPPENSDHASSSDSRTSKFGSFKSGKKLSDRTETAKSNDTAAEEVEEDPSAIPGEVVLRGGSREELGRIFTSALAAGAEFKGIIPDLLAARVKFRTKEAAKEFRDSLDEEYSDTNHVVMAPDIPQLPIEGQPQRNESSAVPLQPFGNRALEFLGVTEDNSNWGADLTIAILDSGVYAHESLRGININQIDLVQTAADTEEVNFTGHGTAVADIAHMVAPAADILSVRVLDSEGIGDTFTVAQGILAATDNGANVINLSLGSDGDSSVLSDAINYATERGVAVVAASGNSGVEQVSYPAAYENVIGVSAIDAAGNFADFSNTGEGVDISAPGVGVSTAWAQDQSLDFSGTSAAAPFVSAAIAASVTRNQGYNINQAAEQVQRSAQDVGEAGRDIQTGNGILDLSK